MDYQDFQNRHGLTDQEIIDTIALMGKRFMEIIQKQRLEIPIQFEEGVFFRRMEDAMKFYYELMDSLGKLVPRPVNIFRTKELVESKETNYLKASEPAHRTDELIMKNLDEIKKVVARLLEKQRKELPFTDAEDRLFGVTFEILLSLWDVQDERSARSFRWSDVN